MFGFYAFWIHRFCNWTSSGTLAFHFWKLIGSKKEDAKKHIPLNIEFVIMITNCIMIWIWNLWECTFTVWKGQLKIWEQRANKSCQPKAGQNKLLWPLRISTSESKIYVLVVPSETTFFVLSCVKHVWRKPTHLGQNWGEGSCFIRSCSHSNL